MGRAAHVILVPILFSPAAAPLSSFSIAKSGSDAARPATPLDPLTRLAPFNATTDGSRPPNRTDKGVLSLRLTPDQVASGTSRPVGPTSDDLLSAELLSSSWSPTLPSPPPIPHPWPTSD